MKISKNPDKESEESQLKSETDLRKANHKVFQLTFLQAHTQIKDAN
jgi:hypothetical protein